MTCLSVKGSFIDILPHSSYPYFPLTLHASSHDDTPLIFLKMGIILLPLAVLLSVCSITHHGAEAFKNDSCKTKVKSADIVRKQKEV